ncbi:large conductance mechanosensitive channel protein MscL [Schaalia hyovaginalis]|uniref:large conductance mechanosensitive channel protein MscL n=1 Tax=Schaalia hyovaginalis TaxID=29316 RepID=UPI002A75A2E2|nr:large conductance mechanosensitive channel protein MscL [Schaalia hyovaginalis]MDY2669389.1 large conductance mechanosensitive channel protein MscL [Schaalia hyovaginalis]
MIKGFKDFISNGNVLELAVAVIIGAAFKPIVDAITNVIMGIIGALVGQPNFDSVLQFTINGSDPIQPGTIITALVNFLLIAAAVYFAIVLPMNKLKERKAVEEVKEEEEPSEDVKLLAEIRDLLASKNA